jgi:alanyl-tRNA synthetase
MQSADIRSRFLSYFEGKGHSKHSSSSLVPADDPTLLFTNAGMVQFKRVFLGLDKPEGPPRATTAQKCVRAGGKHNDLEQVGHTARHHTFFEMLGNFSFGDYFKREAIAFAWDFVTKEMQISPEHLRVTVFHEDDEARALWRELAGLSDSRIYGMGAKDNFWQMADTGPCGPCTEIYVDLARVAKDWDFPDGVSGDWTSMSATEFDQEAFVEGVEAGRFLEIWNLVFMQFDRQPDGAMVPLPRPSVDTGMGLERLAAVLQGVSNNYHTDLFLPLIGTMERLTGIAYRPVEDETAAASFRVIADHARAVAFLLADGVFPSNEGRGYVLRRILRRAVRHAWLLHQKDPFLFKVVDNVVESMGDAYPELRQRRKHLIETTRAEEDRFLATIEGGMRRFNEIAPATTTQGSSAVRGTISGEDAFRLYDTFGFPIDLTEVMARERGYTVDVAAFDVALSAQRAQSQEERRGRKLVVSADELSDPARWKHVGSSDELPTSSFVGYDTIERETDVVGVRELEDKRVAIMLRESPFYAESGGQVSDRGEILGDGWRVDVEDVRRVGGGRVAAIGNARGAPTLGRARARIPRQLRLDTERNHTATHLLHAALRQVLGDHVHQAGSLVAPDRLRFDFTHHGPVTESQRSEIESMVNREIFAATPVRTEERRYTEALAAGAMALFGEKYSDVVRVVTVPGFSMELCGGTHVRNTSEIGLFVILSETGVAAGVRRIEAATGPRAYELLRERDRSLTAVESVVRATGANAVKRVQSLLEERRTLERELEQASRTTGSASPARELIERATSVDGVRLIAESISVRDVKSLQGLADCIREEMKGGVAILAATLEGGKTTLLGTVTDDLRERGIHADALVRDLAATVGGRGGGKPHMAQAGLPDANAIPTVLARAAEILRAHLSGAA